MTKQFCFLALKLKSLEKKTYIALIIVTGDGLYPMKSFFKKDVAYKDIYIHAFFAGIAIKVILFILLK